MAITELSYLWLRPGSNALIAIMDGTTAPIEVPQRIAIVAAELGIALSAEPLFVGAAPEAESMMVFNVGLGRPIYIHPIGPNPTLLELDKKAGFPTGPNPLFFAVNIDWRGDPVHLQGYLTRVIFPKAVRVVNGLPNWPDGTVEEQQARIAQESEDEALADIGTALAQSSMALEQSLAANVVRPAIILGGIALAIIVAMKWPTPRSRRR
jgi:hypothetical protein